MPFRFRPPLSDDAAMILGWRTRPDITRFMVTDIEDPDVERQKAWLAAEAGRASSTQSPATRRSAPASAANSSR